MTITSQPWRHPDPRLSPLSLVQVPARTLHRLALHGLARGAVVHDDETHLSPYLTGDECAGLWRMRSEQIAAAPGDVPWVTRFVVTPGIGHAVGLAGFHGPPDANGMVEVGYRIDPQHRRRGYARQALETLLAVARAHPAVHVVRASISPDNVASRALVQSYGFVAVGEQWDVEDGLEIILEIPATGT